MTFKITYRLYSGARLVKEGVFRVKNRDNEFIAKISLEAYLKKRYTFDRMEVISCDNDMFYDMFGIKI